MLLLLLQAVTGRIIGAPIKVSKIIFLLFVQISSPAVAYDDTLSINERENVNTISTNTALSTLDVTVKIRKQFEVLAWSYSTIMQSWASDNCFALR